MAMRAGTHHCHPSPPCHPLPRHFPSQQQRGEQQCRSQLLPSYNFPPSQLPVGPSNRCPWLQLSPLPRSPLPIPAAGGSHSLPILPQIGGSTARGGETEAGNTQRALPWGLALASSHGHHHPRAEPPPKQAPPPSSQPPLSRHLLSEGAHTRGSRRGLRTSSVTPSRRAPSVLVPIPKWDPRGPVPVPPQALLDGVRPHTLCPAATPHWHPWHAGIGVAPEALV